MCGNHHSLLERVDQGVLKWFGHIERIGAERMVKKMYVSKAEGGRETENPNKTGEMMPEKYWGTEGKVRNVKDR